MACQVVVYHQAYLVPLVGQGNWTCLCPRGTTNISLTEMREVHEVEAGRWEALLARLPPCCLPSSPALQAILVRPQRTTICQLHTAFFNFLMEGTPLKTEYLRKTGSARTAL